MISIYVGYLLREVWLYILLSVYTVTYVRHTAWVDNIKMWTGLPVEESIRMTEINGESTSMVWPTLGSRTAKEQNRIRWRWGMNHNLLLFLGEWLLQLLGLTVSMLQVLTHPRVLMFQLFELFVLVVTQLGQVFQLPVTNNTHACMITTCYSRLAWWCNG